MNYLEYSFPFSRFKTWVCLTFFFCGVVLTAQKVAPVANDDSYTGALNVTLNVPVGNGLLDNDTDANGTIGLTVDTTPVSGPSSGSVALNADGSFSYTPSAGFVGIATFDYRVCDDGTPNPVISRFDFDTPTLTLATVGPDATSVSPIAAQTDCGINIPTGSGGTVGIDVIIPNTGDIFDFTSFACSFEYRDQESTADIVTAGNFRIYHISGNSLGIQLSVINGTTGLPQTFTQTLGNFLPGNVPYNVAYDEVTGEVTYNANGTISTFPVAPAYSSLNTALASDVTIGQFMDNSGSSLPSLCSVEFIDNSRLCDVATVSINIMATLITNRRITYRVKRD